jgi:hypothetical protein
MLKPAASVLVALALLPLCSLAQVPNLTPADGEERPAVPTVSFTLDWPGADPEHYVLAIDSSGRATYESAGGKRFVLGDPYSSKFTVTEATRHRIFDTARTLNYFNRDFEYRKGKVAFTGKKTIAYADASRQFEASYNWTDNHALRQLTELMQAVAATVEFGRSLDYMHRHDRLGLNAELKRMDELAASGQLAELQVLGPQLEQIAGDSSVMEIARQKARRLLQRANAGHRTPASPATAQK